MNFSENAIAEFLLCNDIYGEPALNLEEFFKLKNKFYN